MPSSHLTLNEGSGVFLRSQTGFFGWKNSEGRAKRRRSGELKEIGQLASDEMCLTLRTLLLTLKNTGVFPGTTSSLFQTGVLLHELLLAVSGETNSKFRRLSCAFTAENQSAAILRMTDVGTRDEV
jgi:hypothetical protein